MALTVPTIRPSCSALAVRTVTITPGRRMLSYSTDSAMRLSPTTEAVIGMAGRPSSDNVHVPPSGDPLIVDLTVSGLPSKTVAPCHVPAKSASEGQRGREQRQVGQVAALPPRLHRP